MKEFGKVILMAIWLMSAIAASAAAFNTLEGFYIGCGIINLAVNGMFIFNIFKKTIVEKK